MISFALSHDILQKPNKITINGLFFVNFQIKNEERQLSKE